eukprot:363074-Chlamydomonas_euryale.AAC.4
MVSHMHLHDAPPHGHGTGPRRSAVAWKGSSDAGLKLACAFSGWAGPSMQTRRSPPNRARVCFSVYYISGSSFFASGVDQMGGKGRGKGKGRGGSAERGNIKPWQGAEGADADKANRTFTYVPKPS